MNRISRQEIIDAQDIKTMDVEVPEWGGTVTVKAMSVGDRDAFTVWVSDREGRVSAQDFMAKMVAMCLIDEKGNRMFSDDELPLISAKSIPAIERIFKVVQDLSGMRKADLEEAKNSLKKTE
jgi:hypothetical protein